MRAKDHRLAIPLGVKLKAALKAAGFTEEQIVEGEIEFDHFPALSQRGIDADGEIYPPANDWRFLRPMLRADHDIKTRGTGATTAGSDVGVAAKLKRVAKDPPGGEEFRRKLLAVKAGEPQAETKRPKHKWASRPFQKRNKS